MSLPSLIVWKEGVLKNRPVLLSPTVSLRISNRAHNFGGSPTNFIWLFCFHRPPKVPFYFEVHRIFSFLKFQWAAHFSSVLIKIIEPISSAAATQRVSRWRFNFLYVSFYHKDEVVLDCFFLKINFLSMVTDFDYDFCFPFLTLQNVGPVVSVSLSCWLYSSCQCAAVVPNGSCVIAWSRLTWENRETFCTVI